MPRFHGNCSHKPNFCAHANRTRARPRLKSLRASLIFSGLSAALVQSLNSSDSALSPMLASMV
eukprot:3512155-Lingulodinium_polyedra.AAC.1